MLSKHKILCNKLLGSTFILNKLLGDEWRVVPRLTMEIVKSTMSEMFRCSSVKNEGFPAVSDKKLQCTAMQQKIMFMKFTT